ncbi:hypothetical protein jhhlp_000317 [Lomentospora prolificans]|uniref:Uncharacterized protein n=1 Tax=Lomentospora prolificans TaxID=41688 RepID=A0A2N3NKH6_9PEZI|nr:hypothetical protein jhhlp_000317 [Lomentospora prolificans]
MASRNPESLSNEGEFHARVPRSEPMMKGGHAPGVHVGNDAVREFHAEMHPAGTAPKESSFWPHPQYESPGQAFNPQMEQSTRTEASDTLRGATSADVHQGWGHPGQGTTAKDFQGGHGDRTGLTGVGANKSDPIRERRLDRDVPAGSRGKQNPDNIQPASEKLPESFDV